jgi:hypothetical protein
VVQNPVLSSENAFVKTLTELRAACANLGIEVETEGRASKEPYVVALRDYHWRKDHPDEPLPAQIMPMLLGSWEDLDDAEAEAIEQDHHAWIVQPKMDGARALLHIEGNRVRITSRTVSEVTYRLSEFQDNLPHLTNDISELNGTILDGELACSSRVSTPAVSSPRAHYRPRWRCLPPLQTKPDEFRKANTPTFAFMCSTFSDLAVGT